MVYDLGIDVGTSFTAAAVRRSDGVVEVAGLGPIADNIPTVVYFGEDGSAVVGDSANRRAALDPSGAAREFKRRLGDPTPIILHSSPFSAESLIARMVEHVARRVADRERGQPRCTLVTHPANWGPYKQELFQQALRIANIEPAFTLTEPAAAALAYAAETRVPTGAITAVYDLGGGTFDAAVLRKAGDEFELMGESTGIEHLGGSDFDEAVFQHVRKAVGDAWPAPSNDPSLVAAMLALRRACTEAKELLSSEHEAHIPVLLPSADTTVTLTRQQFERMIEPRIADTIRSLEAAVASAHISENDLTSVLLVGGSSRIPLVADMVRGRFGSIVAVDVDPLYAVARGAAIEAGRRGAALGGEAPRAESTGRSADLRGGRLTVAPTGGFPVGETPTVRSSDSFRPADSLRAPARPSGDERLPGGGFPQPGGGFPQGDEAARATMPPTPADDQLRGPAGPLGADDQMRAAGPPPRQDDQMRGPAQPTNYESPAGPGWSPGQPPGVADQPGDPHGRQPVGPPGNYPPQNPTAPAGNYPPQNPTAATGNYPPQNPTAPAGNYPPQNPAVPPAPVGGMPAAAPPGGAPPGAAPPDRGGYDPSSVPPQDRSPYDRGYDGGAGSAGGATSPPAPPMGPPTAPTEPPSFAGAPRARRPRRLLLLPALVLLVVVGLVAALLARSSGNKSASSASTSSAPTGTGSSQATAVTSAPVGKASAQGMTQIPGNTYWVGSANPDTRGQSESSRRQVKLDPYYIDTVEVTNQHFLEFVNKFNAPRPVQWQNGQFPDAQKDFPVQGVNYDYAVAFCNSIGKRLPKEAEWEVAARGNTDQKYPFGNDEPTGRIADGGSYAVGTVPQNKSPFGVMDMAGNSWEWVSDPYDTQFVGPNDRVLRGGQNGYQRPNWTRLAINPAEGSAAKLAGFRCAASNVDPSVQPFQLASITLPKTPAQPTVQPTPANYFFCDDFHDPTTGWPEYSDNKIKKAYHPNRFYHLGTFGPNQVVAAKAPPTFSADQKIEVSVTAETVPELTQPQDSFEYGIFVRGDAEGNGLTFTINRHPASTTWHIFQRVAGQNREIAHNETKAGEPVTLRVLAVGDNFTFYLNDQYQTSFSRSGLADPYVGLYLASSDTSQKTHIHFSNFEVRRADDGTHTPHEFCK